MIRSLSNGVRIGIVGVFELEAETMLLILSEWIHEKAAFVTSELRLFDDVDESSEAHQTRDVGGVTHSIDPLTDHAFLDLDLVYFFGSHSTSSARVLKWAPIALKAGATVIDSTGTFAEHPETLPCVPAANGHKLRTGSPQIIINPLPLTIGLIHSLQALRQNSRPSDPVINDLGIRDLKVAACQSVSSAGRTALSELLSQSQDVLNGEPPTPSPLFPQPIAFDVLPFVESGYENRVIREVRRILDQPNTAISVFIARVPALNGLGAHVWVELERSDSRPLTAHDLENALKRNGGISLKESAEELTLSRISGHDETYIGLVHENRTESNSWRYWLALDNLRAGTAMNALRIAQFLYKDLAG